MEQTISFGKIDYNQRGRRNCEFTVDMSLTEENGVPVFSASADVWNPSHTDIYTGGQCLDDVPCDDPLFLEIKDLWKRNHLNDMHAGSIKQEMALKTAEEKNPGIFRDKYSGIYLDKDMNPHLIVDENSAGDNRSRYDKQCDYLKEVGLYSVELTKAEKKLNPRYANEPYTYGYGRLTRGIDSEDLDIIRYILEEYPKVKNLPVKEMSGHIMSGIDRIKGCLDFDEDEELEHE